MKINGTGTKVSVNAPGKPSSVKVVEIGPGIAYPIERKAVGDVYATAISIFAANGVAQCSYRDRHNLLLSRQNLTMNTNRTAEEIKAEVFDTLELSEVPALSFGQLSPNTKYVAFGNLVHLENESYAWSGRSGGNHLAAGKIITAPFDSLTRTFGTPVTYTRVGAEDVRGGSHTVINGQIYFFTALYNSSTDTFLKLILAKSTDLTGTSWSEQTLLYAAGTNGGVNETTYSRFNFYGTPVNIGNTWIVPWYEHDTPWRCNFFKSTDNGATWTTHVVAITNTYKVGEVTIAYVGNNTLMAIGRATSSNTIPMVQSVSTDMGETWSAWQLTNLGSSEGQCMGSALLTDEYGLVVVYADRGTGNMMITLGNSVEHLIANPTGYNTPVVLAATTTNDATYYPLGYPSILRVAQKRYMVAYSEQFGGSITNLFIGDGHLDNI